MSRDCGSAGEGPLLLAASAFLLCNALIVGTLFWMAGTHLQRVEQRIEQREALHRQMLTLADYLQAAPVDDAGAHDHTPDQRQRRPERAATELLDRWRELSDAGDAPDTLRVATQLLLARQPELREGAFGNRRQRLTLTLGFAAFVLLQLTAYWLLQRRLRPAGARMADPA